MLNKISLMLAPLKDKVSEFIEINQPLIVVVLTGVIATYIIMFFVEKRKSKV